MTLRYWIKLVDAWDFFPYFRIIVNVLIFSFFMLFAIVFQKMR